MFSHIGGAEVLVVMVLGVIIGLLPLALTIWMVVTLARIQRSVDRIAAALEHRTPPAPRGP